MRRIVVVGPAGSGKTTAASEIARRLDLPTVELDALYWERNWSEAEEDVFRARIRAAVAADRWVIDGNYFSVGCSDIVWPLADTIVFLDLPKHTVMRRTLLRTVRRAALRTELWSGNREGFRKSFLERDSLLRYLWTHYSKYGDRYRQLQLDPEWTHLTWITLRSPREVRAWLDLLPAA